MIFPTRAEGDFGSPGPRIHLWALRGFSGDSAKAGPLSLSRTLRVQLRVLPGDHSFPFLWEQGCAASCCSHDGDQGVCFESQHHTQPVLCQAPPLRPGRLQEQCSENFKCIPRENVLPTRWGLTSQRSDVCQVGETEGPGRLCLALALCQGDRCAPSSLAQVRFCQFDTSQDHMSRGYPN